MTPEEATKQGYVSITRAYTIPSQQWMLDNVMADMARGALDAIIVDDEVWRKPSAD
jgi:hypothetical protein